jgi:hypothetical protein
MQRANTGRTCLLGAALLAALVASEARAADREPLQVTVRREGFVPYVPHARYRINIQVPQAKLLEGWRCCWLEAFSRPVAAQLSLQAQKTVAGNDVDVQLDAWRTESSIRELAPGLFEGELFLSSTQGWGNHAARIYVHLYQAAQGMDNAYDPRTEHLRGPGRPDNRVADDFLRDPFITVRFMYAPRPLQPSFQPPLRPGDTVPGAPPSQLPHY